MKTLYLIHHDPLRTDDQMQSILQDLREKYKDTGISINAATEGQSVEF